MMNNCRQSGRYANEAKKKEYFPDQVKRSKKFTDVWCLIVLVALTIMLLLVGIYSFRSSEIEIFLNGIDSWGNLCGEKKNLLTHHLKKLEMDHSQRPYELHVSLGGKQSDISLGDFFWRRKDDVVVCVEECPAETISCQELMRNSDYDVNEVMLNTRVCKEENNEIVSHSPILNKCVPTSLFQEKTFFSFGGFVRVVSGVVRFNVTFLWFGLGCVCTSFIFFVFVCVLPVYMLTVNTAAAVVGMLAAFVYFCYGFVLSAKCVLFHECVPFSMSDGSLSLLLFVFVLIVSIMIIMYLVSMFRTRNVVNVLFKEAGHIVIRLPFLFVYPLVRLFINCLMFVYCLIVTMLIMFVQSPVPEKFDLIRYEMRQTKLVILMLLVHFVGCFCVVGVFKCFQNVVLCELLCKWYFCCKSESNRLLNVCPSFNVFKYNLGSVFLCSLCETPLHVVRRLFTRCPRFVSNTCTSMNNISNYYNEYNYVCIGTFGLSFWKSGQKSSRLIKEIEHMESAKQAANRTLLIGKLSMILRSMFVTVMYLHFKENMDFTYDNVGVIVINAFVAYLVGCSFLSVHRIVFDSLMINYAIDVTTKNGITYCREQFQDIMAKPVSRNIGWEKSTLRIPMSIANDPRIFIDPEKNYNRVRPRAARGIRKHANACSITDEKVYRSNTNDTMSLDGPVETVLDRFDMFVDKMVVEQELSPLSNRRDKSANTKKTSSVFPPINTTTRINNYDSALTNDIHEDLELVDFDDKDFNLYGNQINMKIKLQKPVTTTVTTATKTPPSKLRDSIQLPSREHELPGLHIQIKRPDRNETKSLHKLKRNWNKKTRVHFEDEWTCKPEETKVDMNPAEPVPTVSKPRRTKSSLYRSSYWYNLY